jgi:hypothetical protein
VGATLHCKIEDSAARQFHRFAWHALANPGILCAKLGLDVSFHCTAILTTRGPVINYSMLPKKVMDPIQLSLSLTGIAVRSQRLMVDFLTRRPDLGGLGDPACSSLAFGLTINISRRVALTIRFALLTNVNAHNDLCDLITGQSIKRSEL